MLLREHPYVQGMWLVFSVHTDGLGSNPGSAPCDPGQVSTPPQAPVN